MRGALRIESTLDLQRAGSGLSMVLAVLAVMTLIVLSAIGHGAAAASQAKNGPGWQWEGAHTPLAAPRPVSGDGAAESDPGEARTVVLADVDRNGAEDLLLGYATAEGRGLLTLVNGRLPRCASNDEQCQPFSGIKRAWTVPEPADWILAGDFDADGVIDVATAARGSRRLYLLAGDGEGGYRQAESHALPGAVTAMAAGEVNRRDGLTDMVIAVTSENGSQLVVLESPFGLFGDAAELLPLPDSATSLILDRLDGGSPRDIAAACGSQIVVVHGRDRRLGRENPRVAPPARMQSVALGTPVQALAVLQLSGDEAREIVALGEDGELHLLSCDAEDEWSHRVGPQVGTGSGAAQLLVARTSGRSRPDLVLARGSQLEVLGISGAGGESVPLEVERAALELSGSLVDYGTARLNSDALYDLVLLVEGAEAPLYAVTAPEQTFLVNSTDDLDDGSCDSTHCSLRDAIIAANATPELDTIELATGASPIQPLSPLPEITEPVDIVGYWDFPLFLNSSLDGSLCAGECTGLTISGAGSSVRGLNVYSFPHHGIEISDGGDGSVVAGCVIGTNASWEPDLNNGHAQVAIQDSSNNTVGGLASSDRNVLVGAGYPGGGVTVRATDSSAQGNQVINNLIGVTPDGTDMGNYNGVRVENADSTTIGVAGGGNIIAGNNAEIKTYSTIINNIPDIDLLIQSNTIGIFSDTNYTQHHNYGVIIEHVGGVTIGGLGGGNVIAEGAHSSRSCVFLDRGPTDGADLVVWGNHIGIGADGETDLGCSDAGIRMGTPTNVGPIGVSIGGTWPGSGNVISGNDGDGVAVCQSSNVTIAGNLIGTNASGTSAVPNEQSGITVGYGSLDTRVGGNAAGNLVSGNGWSGIKVRSNPPQAVGTIVQGNQVGVAIDGSPLANQFSGIVASGVDTLIGGGTVNLGNLVAFNGDEGIVVQDTTCATLRRNIVHDNDELGIDLGPSGVNPNDADDEDTGDNNRQNYPVVTAADPVVGSVTLELDSTPSRTFDIDLFASSSCDPSGYGEAETYLGSAQLTTDAEGDATATFGGLSFSVGWFLTATATDPDGNTSELSACYPVTEPEISVSDCSVDEGDSGSTDCVFILTLSKPWSDVVSVGYATGNGTASPGSDYQSAIATLSFSPGETSLEVAVPVLGDELFEGDETFELNLGNSVNATLADATGVATIADDDPEPLLSVADTSATEGDSGSRDLSFVVTLSPGSAQAVSVQFATIDSSATAGADYQPTSGTLSFSPGQTSYSVSVAILGDTIDEWDEEFALRLTSPSGAVIDDAEGIAQIYDDDPEPDLSVDDCSVVEGDSGMTLCSFTVSLSEASGKTVIVDYATSDGTATAGSDYTEASGQLSFAPGQSILVVDVEILGDEVLEADEVFTLSLSSPVNAEVDDGQGRATITNDDVDKMFSDDFETGDLSAWSSSSL